MCNNKTQVKVIGIEHFTIDYAVLAHNNDPPPGTNKNTNCCLQLLQYHREYLCDVWYFVLLFVDRCRRQPLVGRPIRLSVGGGLPTGPGGLGGQGRGMSGGDTHIYLHIYIYIYIRIYYV